MDLSLLTIRLPLEEPASRVQLRIQTVCELDMIVPRSRAAIRNRAEHLAAAAELGALALQRQDFAVAGRWLRVAYNGRERLPDGGRRVRMQLRELARRLAQRGQEAGDHALEG